MSLLSLFRKPALEPLPAETYEASRRRQLDADLARIESELEAIDQQITDFFHGPDPRISETLKSSSAIMRIENYSVLGRLELARDAAAMRRNRILNERGSLT